MSQAFVISTSLSLAATTVYASGGKNTTKGSERAPQRPVARMLSTSSRTEIPPQVKARLVARVSAPSAPAYAAAAAVATSGDERRAFELVNAERAKRGLRPLVLDGSLTRVARFHSDNMAREGFFNHVDRDGLDISGRAQMLGLRGWRTLGENIAYNQGYSDPTAFAVERWMISSKHRENILNGEYTHAGLGIARSADGRVFFTQVFMRR
ncbi:MAG TPA: CAP domain-containing protein [Pyrinomonadaceae bacterium]|nr:CAP domain-containing protein [Pyrinomonadaceae bacterium]